MIIQESVELSSRLRQDHDKLYGHLPDGISLVVSEYELVYVVSDSDDPRLNDRPVMEFKNHRVRCLAAIMLRGAMDGIARWCHEKADWYDHVVLGHPQPQT